MFSFSKSLTRIWSEPELSDIVFNLKRSAGELEHRIARLGDTAGVLYSSIINIILDNITEILGYLRQEQTLSNTVTVMEQSVDTLTKNRNYVHEKLLKARKVLGENNLDVGKEDVHLEISPDLTTQKDKDDSQSVTSHFKREVTEDDYRNCDFRRICVEKGCSKILTERRRKESSKKVSIAENLNCNYSDYTLNDTDNAKEYLHEKVKVKNEKHTDTTNRNHERPESVFIDYLQRTGHLYIHFNIVIFIFLLLLLNYNFLSFIL